MKTKILITAILLISITGCSKHSDNNTIVPTGKWKSVAFKNGDSWQPEVILHYFEIKENNTYSFRDHNGVLCTGKLFPVANNARRIHFQDSDCGLTDRTVENLSTDTLELSVAAPPNITHDRVKYAREN